MEQVVPCAACRGEATGLGHLGIGEISMRVLALMAAGVAAIAVPASAATIVSANAAYATPRLIDPFGPIPNSPTYGQVFVSAKAGKLTAFTFNLTGGVGQISAGLGTWTGGFNYTSGGGSPTTLWQSGLVDSNAGAITFMPDVDILDNAKYVAYITVYGSPDAAGSTSLVLGDNSSAALKYFIFDNGAGNPAGNPAWLNYDNDVGDALFSFSVAVPEPAQWAMMIAGFGMIGTVARRRRSGLAVAA